MTVERELKLAHGTMILRFSAHGDAGRVRPVNEDSFYAVPPVFLVADGMGGHARGEVASKTVIDVFHEHIEADEPSTPERILDAIHSSNDAVRDLSDDGERGAAVAGTTVAGVAVVDAGEGQGDHWMVFNVGDSRVYGWDGDVLSMLTVDHTAVQQLVDVGIIAPADAETHPERNVITRAIGTAEYAEADIALIPVQGRQVFLVCSDGLTKELDDDRIGALLAGGADAEALVAAAIAEGGRDNVSVVLIESAVASG